MDHLTPEELARNPDRATQRVIWQDNQVTLRLIRPEDGPALGRYFEGLGPGTRGFYGPHPLTMDEALELADEIDHTWLLRCLAVDEAEGEIMAYFILVLGVQAGDVKRYEALGIPLDSETDATLAPSVAERYQSQGLGSVVMGWVLDLARRLGKKRVVLMGGVQELNERGRHFYGKFGFRKVGEFMNRAGTINNHDMILDLAP